MIFSEQSLNSMLNPMALYPKTQIRRRVKSGDDYHHTVLSPMKVRRLGGKLRWQVGNIYAIQPGRGKQAIARFRLLDIKLEDVRNISLKDARAEGYKNEIEFWRVWCGFHDPKGIGELENLATTSMVGLITGWESTRPANCYQAWVLTFEVI